MSAYLAVLRRYADFTGRSSRREFWTFTLVQVLLVFLWLAAASATADDETLSGIVSVVGVGYMLATIVPELAARVRRLHDSGRSGWWLLLAAVPFVGPVVVLVLLCQAGEARANAYGPQPEDFTPAVLEPATAAA